MHPHTHHHHPDDHAAKDQRLLYALILTALFTLVELVGGLWSGSLALLADAGHMLTDTVALGLAFGAARLARRPADPLRSYGYHRVQILAAFINGIGFLLMVGWILVEAAQRMLNPPEVMGEMMLGVAVLGLLVNLAAFKLLHGGHQHDLNVRSALLHVLWDLLGSVAAIVAGVVILWTGWMPIDPLLSVLVALLILRSAISVVRQSGHIPLEGAPVAQDAGLIRDTLMAEIPAVTDVHHVHLWSLTPERPMLTLHASLQADADWPATLARIKSVLGEHFGLDVVQHGHGDFSVRPHRNIDTELRVLPHPDRQFVAGTDHVIRLLHQGRLRRMWHPAGAAHRNGEPQHHRDNPRLLENHRHPLGSDTAHRSSFRPLSFILSRSAL